jgi:hypothetical protein
MPIPPEQDSSVFQMVSASNRRAPVATTHRAPDWPDGFTQVDIAVLEWIAAEGRRIGRACAA